MNNLEKKITEYAESYYSGNPQIEDSQFDFLIEKLRKENPDSEILSSVSWGSTGGLSKRFKSKHYGNSVVTGLNKIKYPEHVSYKNAVITPKIDGASVCLYYKNGLPFSLITRGNGYEGMSILHKFPNRFPRIDIDDLICIRGEAYIPNSMFDELKQKGVPSPRNYVSGIINRYSGIEDSDLKYVKFIFYQVRIFNKKINSKVSLLNEIKKMNLPTVDYIETDNLDPESLKFYYNKFSKFDYPIDGIVITNNVTSNNSDIKEESIAYKFESNSAEVVVSDVEWSIGSSGRLNPVVVFEPVSLSGAIISRATGFNYRYIVSNGIGKGSIIEVTRSNEVIPYIKNVLFQSKVDVITKCPSCGSPLECDGVFLRCKNKNCSSRLYESFYRIISLPGLINGIGSTTLNSLFNFLVDKYIISNVLDILRYVLNFNKKESNKTELLSIFKSHYYSIVSEQINNAANYIYESIKDSDIWYIMNLPLIGETISKKFPSTESVLNNSINYSNYSDRISDLIRNNEQNIINIVDFLKYEYNITIKRNKIVDNNKKFKVCYTGKTDNFANRKEFFSFYSEKVVESGIESAEYLICNKASNSSKYRYAKENNIKILSEKEFIDTVL